MYCLGNKLSFLCLFCRAPLYGYTTCDNCNSTYSLEFDTNSSTNKIKSISKLYKYKGKIYYIDYDINNKCIEIYLTLLVNMISVNHYNLHNIIDYKSRVSMYLNMPVDNDSDRKILYKYIKLRNIT